MKRYLAITLSLAVLCSLVLAPCASADHPVSGSWKSSLIETGSSELFGYTSGLVVADDGTPYVLYPDDASALVRFAYMTGGTWNISTLAADAGYFCRLEEGPDGVLHGAYMTTQAFLYYGTYDGEWTWQQVGPMGYGGYQEMAVDGDGNPHIAFVNMLTGQLTYSSYDGASWTHEEIVNVGVNLNNFRELGLALDAEGNPYISSYYEPGGATSSLICARRVGDIWQVDEVDTIGERGKGSAAIVDNEGVVHVAYRDSDANDLRHAWFDGETWQNDRIDGNGDVGYHASLALDAKGYVNVAYYDRDTDYMRYAWWDGSAWRTEALAGIGPCRDSQTSLVIDDLGQPYMLASLKVGADRQFSLVWFESTKYHTMLPMILS